MWLQTSYDLNGLAKDVLIGGGTTIVLMHVESLDMQLRVLSSCPLIKLATYIYKASISLSIQVTKQWHSGAGSFVVPQLCRAYHAALKFSEF